jgi:thiol:disulfide interchange protein DsbD
MSKLKSKLTHSVIAGLTLTLLLIPAAFAQLTPTANSTLFSGDRPRPLPIDQAFPFYVSLNSPETLQVSWQIAEGHYLYRQQFGFALKQDNESEAVSISFTLPDGLKKQDQFFGDIEAYYEGVTATLNLSTDQLSTAILVIQYQGCAEWGFCYPPQSTEYPLNP